MPKFLKICRFVIVILVGFMHGLRRVSTDRLVQLGSYFGEDNGAPTRMNWTALQIDLVCLSRVSGFHFWETAYPEKCSVVLADAFM
jgi:hypothetical protein